jgi:multidrug efflux system membrane fusion protein
MWPGQFVDTVLTLTTQSNAVVIPSQAVQTGQQGQFVFAVKDDMTVESRAIVTGRTITGETVVESGLRPGERVVTDGQLRLVPGSKIREVKRG